MGITSFFSDISNPPNRVYLARAGHKFGFFGVIHGFTDITRDGDAAAADGKNAPRFRRRQAELSPPPFLFSH